VRISEVSIERPVLAAVMSLLIVVSGAVAFFMLPVREYPDVDPPQVSVRTVYPGASPETVETTVTEPLEQVLNGIEGIRTIESTSGFGMSMIGVEFVVGRDVDLAATDVSNAIQRGLGDLPTEAERPIVSKAGARSRPIMWLNVKGDRYAPEDRTDLADRIVKTPLQVLPGVSRAWIGGSRRYAMRIWLDPVRMAARGVDAADVRRAIRENNLQAPAGALEAAARKFTVNVDAVIDDPRVYEQIIIRQDDGVPVRIGDVGQAELGAESYQVIARFSREPTVGVGIVRQSRANELEVARAVRAQLPEIRESLPEDVVLDVAVDNTFFVEAALRQVWETLGIVFLVVVLVNLIFLRSPITTAITAVAIPVSLIGTFAVMQLLGFSINFLTLLAMVLAIGLLVDDSIVVLENVYRRQELGEPMLRAARNGSREVGFPVIATTAAVVAVLIPLSIMTGNLGRLFREFAITMAAAVGISTFVALSLVPMLCSQFLRLQREHGPVFQAVEGVLSGAAHGYRRALDWSLGHRAAAGMALVVIVALIPVLLAILPSTLVPVEDRGTFITFIRAPQGSTSAYTDQAMRQVEAKLAETPEVDGFFAAIGLGMGGIPDSADGVVYTRLHPWETRDRTQQEIVADLFPHFFSIPQALVFPINIPSLGQGRSSDIHVVIKSPFASLEDFRLTTEAILPRLQALPGLVNIDTDLRLDNPQLDLRFDRERAADVGVPVSSVAESLRLLVSQGAADDFVLRNKQYDVVMALATRYGSVPDQLGEVHLRARDGSMVPMATLVEAVPVIGPTSLNHYDLQRSATITANLGPDATLGEALPQVLKIVDEELPRGFGTALGGVSREFVESSGAVFLTFGIALIVIFLVLAAQFESFVHPLTVMFSVPLASLGALAGLALTGNTMNLYSQIGIILLVGLVTKNSILLVDFANQERARGTGLLESLRIAGRTRFRPILMTSTTSILGAVPLAMAFGAGAESRRPIGTAIVAGLLFSTVFTLMVIPVVYYVVTRLAERLGLNTIPPRVEFETDGAPSSPITGR
jgi:multidrug efflux pump